MDRSLYISYTVLLDKRILAQYRRSLHILLRIFLIQNTNTPIKFLAPLSRINKSLVTLLTTCKIPIKFLAPLSGTDKSLVTLLTTCKTPITRAWLSSKGS